MSNIKIFCDGGARGNPGPGAAAIVVEKEGKVFFKHSKFLGKVTNNVAEYNAALLAFYWLNKNQDLLNKETLLFFDSELVAKQLSGVFKIKNENLKMLFKKIKSLEKKIPTKILFFPIPRNKNKLADFLVNKELDFNEKNFTSS
jgi:ribonuclease HI